MTEQKRRTIQDIPNPKCFFLADRSFYMKKELKNFLLTIFSTLIITSLLGLISGFFSMRTDIIVLKSQIIERENDINQLREEIERIENTIK